MEAAPPAASPLPPAPPRRSVAARLWSAAQFVVALGVTAAFLAYLLLAPTATPPAPADAPAPLDELVEVTGPGLIRVKPGGPFAAKVQSVGVRSATVTAPMMAVTGRVVASLRPGLGKGDDYWQFDTPELLTAYTDWRKAQADIPFFETSLAVARKFDLAQMEAQRGVVARLEGLVSAGTDTPKDLASERALLIKYELSGRQAVHEAETAVKNARRAEAGAAKQLQQSGLDPALLNSATSDIDIVLADVPEGRLNRVKIGQGCVATFFGLPDEPFGGKVVSIAPVLSKERRSLRVLFTVNDLADQLRPGMFGEIGLGTDPRQTLMIPADGVLHIGRADYALVAAGPDAWRVAEVKVGEMFGVEMEALSGVTAADRVVGTGAILFKPLAVRALGLAPPPAPLPLAVPPAEGTK